MHRSGTSVLTQVMGIAGAQLPAQLIGATADNPYGHWEPVWLNDRNERLLKDLGSAWNDWSGIDFEAAGDDLWADYIADLCRFVEGEIVPPAPLLLKEPRTCRLLPQILRALERIRVEPLVVIPYRNPLEVAASLEARDGMPRRDGVLLWLRHILEAERGSRGCRRSFAAYEALLDDWRAEMARIAGDLGIAWPRGLDEIAPEVEGAIVRDARHNLRSPEDLEASPYASGLALRAFRACERLAANPHDARAQAALNAVSVQFEELVALTLPSLLESRRALAEASAEAGAQGDRASALERRAEELEHNLKGIWQLHDVVSELNQKNELFIASLRAQLEEERRQRQAAEASSARLPEVERALQAKEAEAEQLAQGIAARIAEIERLVARMDERSSGPFRRLGLRLRRSLGRLSLALWRRLPMSPSARIRWKNRIFSSAAGRHLLGSTALYQQWQSLQIMRFDLGGGGAAVQPPAQDDGPVTVDGADHFLPRRAQVELPDPLARLICFYLPQFHAIPENDAWWGEGFTEWSNVRPAQPMFPGHHQPHEPLDLGYYDLTDLEAQKRQVELARLYGIGGFCFYWYWFGGKRLLEKPVENWLNHPELDFPFCLCWANENWTRRWDGKDAEVLIGQAHSPEDDLAFIAELAPYLRDPRYIRIDGRPLVLVYRPSLLPDARATAARWRDWCRENGLGEIYLAYTQSFELEDPAAYGFDAAIEFPPNNASPTVLTDRVEGLDPEFEGIIYDWNSYVDRSRDYPRPDYRLIRSVCPAWDNTARRKKRGAIFLNSTPGEYGRWLGNAITRTLADAPTPDQRLIFCNAWNEWAEGAHLEPDTRFGYAWLETSRTALDPRARPRHVTLVGHDAHPHGAQILLLGLARAYRQAGLAVKILLLEGGELARDYAEVAQVVQLPDPLRQREEALRLMRGLRHEHDEVAIANTTVSGHVVPLLQEAGYSPVALIHEMRSVHEQMDLGGQMRALAGSGVPLVFPARIVREHFEATLGHAVSRAVLRPQGLYLRPAPGEAGERAMLRAEFAIPEGAPLLLGAGYVDRRKGADLFVRALARLRGSGVPAEAIWIGHADRDELARVTALAEELGVAPHVRFPGRMPDPARFHAAADLFLLTSREDPYPSVTLEAMAAETPVVMFAGVTGSADLAEQGLARAVPAEDAGAMAQAAAEILADAEGRQRMTGAAARHIAEHGSFTGYAFDLLALAGRPVPRISVIVPSYNYEAYIRERIESVAAQDMPILEIIVLDDASTDASPRIISELAETSPAPIRFVPSEANSGNVFRQWQRGIALARGDYIWIAEADDLAAPDFLSTVMPGFEDPDVVLSYCESAQIDGAGNMLAGDYRYYTDEICPGKWDRNYINAGPAEIREALSVKNTILNASAVVMRADALREVFAAHGPEIEALRFAGDWAVYLRLLAKGKIAYSAQSRNLHRRHASSVTLSAQDRRQLDEIGAMQALARELGGPDEAREARARAYLEELEQRFGLKAPRAIARA